MRQIIFFMFLIIQVMSLKAQKDGIVLPKDWRAPYIMPEIKPYVFPGGVYDPCIDAGFSNIYNDGPGDHATNQQPSVAVSSEGIMVVVWTQASQEGAKDQSMVSCTSFDGGRSWKKPVDIERAADKRTGSWGYIFCVPHTGRFYCFYWYDENQSINRDGGRIYFRYSDDNCTTWSSRYPIAMPRHDMDVEGEDSHGWSTGFPILMPDGAMLLGFTKIGPDMGADAGQRVGAKGSPNFWRTEVFFLRAENILSETDPEKLKFRVTPSGSEGLWMPDEEDPKLHFCQEPFMALLPSGRVICTMRVMNGYPVYSVSNDYGVTWSKPLPLRNRPGGDLLKHVCGPCQISSTADGRIFFLFSNRNDIPESGSPNYSPNLKRWVNRDPIHVVVGREMPLLTKGIPAEKNNAGIYFDKPRIILSGVDGQANNRYRRRSAQYPQLLHLGNRHLIFYSNYKMDIRVKEVPDELITGFGIPTFP